MVGVKAWNDAHKRLLYVREELGSVLRPLSRAWPLAQAQSRPFLAALQQGQGGKEEARG